MNKLCLLKELGFKIPWILIAIGLYGDFGNVSLITRVDVVNYLEDLLTCVDEQTDKVVTLICEKENWEKFDRILAKMESLLVKRVVRRY